MKQPLKCHHCGRKFANANGSDLCCGAECAKAHESAKQGITDGLVAVGFKQESGSPTAYTKDGVTVTVQEVLHVGMDKAMAAHSAAAKAVSVRAYVSTHS